MQTAEGRLEIGMRQTMPDGTTLQKAPFFVIIASDIDNTQRSQIHEVVKRDGEDWWHQLPDVWVVKGGELATWQRSMKVIASIGNSAILTLALKPTPGARWAVAGDAASMDHQWFGSVMTRHPPGAQSPKQPESHRSASQQPDEPPF